MSAPYFRDQEEQTSQERGARQEKSEVRPHEKADKMGDDQADQTDDPREGYSRRRQEGCAENDNEAEPFHGNPKRLRLLIAKREQIDPPP